MTTNKIAKLLSKKGWTGREVGKVLFASLANDIQNRKKPDYKPLLSQSELELMESSLIKNRDIEIYGVYRSLYYAVLDAFNVAQGILQQYSNGYYRYITRFSICSQSEDAAKLFYKLPLVLKDSQYKRYCKEVKNNLKQTTEDRTGLMFKLLSFFIENPEQTPQDIKKALEAYKKETVNNTAAVDYFKNAVDAVECGYLELEDGTQSTGSIEDFIKHVDKTYSEKHGIKGSFDLFKYRTVTAFKLYYEGIEGIKKQYYNITGKELNLTEEEEKILLDKLEARLGIEDKKIIREKTEHNNIIALLLTLIEEQEIKYIPYTGYPEELNKYEIIERCIDYYHNDKMTFKMCQTKLEEFKEDYPALYKSLEAYIDTFMTGKAITWEELAALNIADFKKKIEPTESNIAQYHADITGEDVKTGGIAILTSDHKQPENPLNIFYDIETMPEDEKAAVKEAVDVLIIPALSQLYAYNALIDIIGDVYSIKEKNGLKLDLTIPERQINHINELFYIFYGEAGGKNKATKRKLINETFILFNLEDMKPTQENIDKVRAQIEEIGFTGTAPYRNLDKFNRALRGA